MTYKKFIYIIRADRIRLITKEGVFYMEEENKSNVEKRENARRAALLLILFIVLAFLCVTLAILTSI